MITSGPMVRRALAPSTPTGSTAVEASVLRAGFREIAWLLVKYRTDKGLSQQRLAEMVGTSHSQISRIESGRHRTNLDTLQRIAKALDLTVVIGFESSDGQGRAVRDLVCL
jgi:ribosome-binding protein aMBF1 (putative translation factor)